jgi:hypothetical protein
MDTPIDHRSILFLSLLTAFLILLTFGIAINTPPISGAFCLEDCIDYPYLDIQDRFPRDYIWMFPAILLNISYFILTVHIHRKIYQKMHSYIAIFFAFASMLILNLDYFVQLTVVQPAILRNEADGISLLTQYNPHGLFIVLEEFGYMMMSLSFLFLGMAASHLNRLELSSKWILIGSFALSAFALVWTRARYGFDTGYLLEVIIISINWLALLAYCVVLAVMVRRK